MATVAFVQNKLGKTDGVSLEVDKWRSVLVGRMGHTVHYCAGNDDVPGIHCIPELSLLHPEVRKVLANGTVALADYAREDELLDDVRRLAAVIRGKLLAFLRDCRVDVLLPNNLLSIGYNIPAMVALAEVIRETGILTICHSHDFYFEESGEVSPTCPAVREIFERYAPPHRGDARLAAGPPGAQGPEAHVAASAVPAAGPGNDDVVTNRKPIACSTRIYKRCCQTWASEDSSKIPPAAGAASGAPGAPRRTPRRKGRSIPRP